jgi:hypothetical protein
VEKPHRGKCHMFAFGYAYVKLSLLFDDTLKYCLF